MTITFSFRAKASVWGKSRGLDSYSTGTYIRRDLNSLDPKKFIKDILRIMYGCTHKKMTSSNIQIIKLKINFATRKS